MSVATTSPTTTSLSGLLESRASAKDIERHLDGLSPADRVEEVLSITGSGVGRLYDAVAGGPAPTLEDFVPAGSKETVIFEGRNSLLAFTRFQKRFLRLESGVMIGYNHQSMSFITGPGYFVLKAAPGTGEFANELLFDYTEAAPEAPPGWPAYKPNLSGLSVLVYGHMKDYVRHVARGIVVGKAYKKGVDQKAFFSLSRPVK